MVFLYRKFLMQDPFRKWARIALFNLVLVALVGIILRYKILFPLPQVAHKDLLHGHSHFAFTGWVSLALFTALCRLISPDPEALKRYSRLFLLLYLSALGMLFSFPFGGYRFISILFSTLSICISYVLCYYCWKDLSVSRVSKEQQYWFKAGLAFNAFSSLGAFFLAWQMATHHGTTETLIGSVYFFLHFQYNGWFLFTIGGLVFHTLQELGIPLSGQQVRRIFFLFLFSAIPGYLLSALWMNLPAILHLLAALAVFLQLTAIVYLFHLLWQHRKKIIAGLQQPVRLLWTLSSLAFLLKCLMQSVSVIPKLSYLAFGFRPIVIGYLHLVLLGVVTLFLLGYLIREKLVSGTGKQAQWGIGVFIGGLLLNETVLMVQGIFAIAENGFSPANTLLLAAALIMWSGITLLLLAQRKRGKEKAISLT